MLIQGKIYSYGDDLSEVYQIRKNVFIEEMGKFDMEESDDMDTMSNHVIVYEGSEDKNPVAVGSIYFDGDTYLIRKVAVLKQYRRRKYGDFVVRMLINRALLSGADTVFARAEKESLNFFETMNFHKVPQDAEKRGQYSEGEGVLMYINVKDMIPPCQKEFQ